MEDQKKNIYRQNNVLYQGLNLENAGCIFILSSARAVFCILLAIFFSPHQYVSISVCFQYIRQSCHLVSPSIIPCCIFCPSLQLLSQGDTYSLFSSCGRKSSSDISTPQFTSALCPVSQKLELASVFIL